MIQYSDTPRLEISLGRHQSVAALIQAIRGIKYMGGNTQAGRHASSSQPYNPTLLKPEQNKKSDSFVIVWQTGRAIKFAVDHVFSSSQRGSQVKNRIAVVVTDGKSQDDVVNVSLSKCSNETQTCRCCWSNFIVVQDLIVPLIVLGFYRFAHNHPSNLPSDQEAQ